jgi:hypothetical protein
MNLSERKQKVEKLVNSIEGLIVEKGINKNSIETLTTLSKRLFKSKRVELGDADFNDLSKILNKALLSKDPPLILLAKSKAYRDKDLNFGQALARKAMTRNFKLMKTCVEDCFNNIYDGILSDDLASSIEDMSEQFNAAYLLGTHDYKKADSIIQNLKSESQEDVPNKVIDYLEKKINDFQMNELKQSKITERKTSKKPEVKKSSKTKLKI